MILTEAKKIPVPNQTPGVVIPGWEYFSTQRGSFPASSQQQIIDQQPNANKLTASERWLQSKLPNVSKVPILGGIVNLLGKTASTKLGGAIFSGLDIMAEGLERTIGLAAQYKDKDPMEDFDFKSAWYAGSLFYDTADLPLFKIDKGRIVGINIPDDLGGLDQLAEIRKDISNGATLEEARTKYYNSLGALSFRAQLYDTYGHLLLDPANAVLPMIKPIERIKAMSVMAATGKITTEAVETVIKVTQDAEQMLRSAGKMEEAAKRTEDIASLTRVLSDLNAGKIKKVTTADKIAMYLTGVDKFEDVETLSKTKQFIRRHNLLALTPESRAMEYLTNLSDNVGEKILSNPNLSIDDIADTLERAAAGSLGKEFGVGFLSLEGRSIQGTIKGWATECRQLVGSYNVLKENRNVIQQIATMMDDSVDNVLKNMTDNPSAVFRAIKENPASKTLFGDLGKIVRENDIDKLIRLSAELNGTPFTTEKLFRTYLRTKLEDFGMRSAIIKFGVKERKFINRWASALKSAESLAFLGLNPTYYLKNVVNNDITLLARGIFGTMTTKQLDQFIEDFGFIPRRLTEGFTQADVVEKMGSQFGKIMEEALYGAGDTAPDKIRKFINKLEPKLINGGDFRTLSSKMEAAASKRGMVNGMLEWLSDYATYTKPADFFSPTVLDDIMKVNPTFTDDLYAAVRSAGANEQKLYKALGMNININPEVILDKASEKFGANLRDFIPPEIRKELFDGMSDAIIGNKLDDYMINFSNKMQDYLNSVTDARLSDLKLRIAEEARVGGDSVVWNRLSAELDQFHAGHAEYNMRQSRLADAARGAAQTGDFELADTLWTKLYNDGDEYFSRVYKRMEIVIDAFEDTGKTGGNISRAFSAIKDEWKDFFNYRKTARRTYLDDLKTGKTPKMTWDEIDEVIDKKYDLAVAKEELAYKRIDDIILSTIISNKSREATIHASFFKSWRDSARKIRSIDRESVKQLYVKLKNVEPQMRQPIIQKFQKERVERLRKMEEIDKVGTAAMGGNPQAVRFLLNNKKGKILDFTKFNPIPEEELAKMGLGEYAAARATNTYGIIGATKDGHPFDSTIISAINKSYSKFTDDELIKMEEKLRTEMFDYLEPDGLTVKPEFVRAPEAVNIPKKKKLSKAKQEEITRRALETAQKERSRIAGYVNESIEAARKGDKQLFELSKDKLRQLGLSDDQIELVVGKPGIELTNLKDELGKLTKPINTTPNISRAANTDLVNALKHFSVPDNIIDEILAGKNPAAVKDLVKKYGTYGVRYAQDVVPPKSIEEVLGAITAPKPIELTVLKGNERKYNIVKRYFDELEKAMKGEDVDEILAIRDRIVDSGFDSPEIDEIVEGRKTLEEMYDFKKQTAWTFERPTPVEAIQKELERISRIRKAKDQFNKLETMTSKTPKLERQKVINNLVSLGFTKEQIKDVWKGKIPLENILSSKYSILDEIPRSVTDLALEKRLKEGNTPFLAEITKIIQAQAPRNLAMDEFMYGRGFDAMDAIQTEAKVQAKKAPTIIKDMPENLQNEVMKYVEQVRGDFMNQRSAAIRFGEWKRDSALLNYSRRTNFDALVGNFLPFGFWTTNSMVKWAFHTLDRPAMMSTYYRMRNFMETAGAPEEGVPSRIRGSIRVKLPFVPDWMGDQFIDPLKMIFPFDNFTQSIEQWSNIQYTAQGRAERLLNNKLESGQITLEEFNNAMETHTGRVWEMAFSEVKENDDSLKFDAWDFVNTMSAPHAPMIWAYKIAMGQKDEIGPLMPFTRTARDVATVMGIKDWNNSPLNLEAQIRKQLGLSTFDGWDDYRIDRTLSNMAADGVYTIEEIKQAMVERKGEVYDEAVKRANQEYTGGAFGAALKMLGISVKSYPTGEHAQRNLATEFASAWEQDKKDETTDNVQAFFDAHPEYEARLALWKTPEERLTKFLTDNLYDKYYSYPKVNQQEIADQLGQEFADTFLYGSKEEQAEIPIAKVQLWLKLIGGKVIGMLEADERQLDLMTSGQLKLTSPNIAYTTQMFYTMRDTYFKDWREVQNGYFEITGSSARKAYLAKNPMLSQYWNWRNNFMYRNPQTVPYLTDKEELIIKAQKQIASGKGGYKPQFTKTEWSQLFPPSAMRMVQLYMSGGEIPQISLPYFEQEAKRLGYYSIDDMLKDITIAFAQ